MSAAAPEALAFEPSEVKFDWTNEAWSTAFLPSVRVATVLLAKDEAKLLFYVSGLGPDLAAEAIMLLSSVASEMEQLLAIVRAANARLCTTSEVAFPSEFDATNGEASNA